MGRFGYLLYPVNSVDYIRFRESPSLQRPEESLGNIPHTVQHEMKSGTDRQYQNAVLSLVIKPEQAVAEQEHKKQEGVGNQPAVVIERITEKKMADGLIDYVRQNGSDQDQAVIDFPDCTGDF